MIHSLHKIRSAYFYQSVSGKEPAKEWLNHLKDKAGKAKILGRVKRAEAGNFGDYKNLCPGLYELRIHTGPGYRVYFGIDETGDLIVLLIAGTKATQGRDIEKARSYWLDYKIRRSL